MTTETIIFTLFRLVQKRLHYTKGFDLFIEKWKFILDNKEYVDAILMDLSKAFDAINYKLLVAKLNTYGFGKETPKLIFS